ncbi:MAG: amino acid permease, partial [Betaproteobacteria bacterium]
TGARTTYAFGASFAAFRGLGAWREAGSTPANALLLQGVITLILVGASAATPDGFSAMVAYTAPVFWTFFLLTGISAFILRRREAAAPAFRVPLFPLIGAAFCAMCAFMLWKSVGYIMNPQFGPKFGNLVLAGLVVMAIGIPVYLISGRK